MSAPVVRWVNADTGETEDLPIGEGRPHDVGHLSAIDLVPLLRPAIVGAVADGRSIEITVTTCRSDGEPSTAWRLARLEGLAQALVDELDGDNDLSPEVIACVRSVREALTKGARP